MSLIIKNLITNFYIFCKMMISAVKIKKKLAIYSQAIKKSLKKSK